jgi:hypothetical protein
LIASDTILPQAQLLTAPLLSLRVLLSFGAFMIALDGQIRLQPLLNQPLAQ